MDEFHLRGSPADLGTEFAAQVADSDRSLADVAPESLDPSPAVREFARECVPQVREHAPGLLDELDAVAEAAGVEREGVRAVALAADADPGCSLVGVPGERTESGSALFARNHDFYPSFRQYSKLYRTDPTDRLASVGCAHGLAGRLDGVNEAGLAVGFAGVPTEEYDPGVMWPLAVRTVLDTCETAAEAVDYLESVPHARNVNVLVADADGDVAVVEASPGAVEMRRPDDGDHLLVATNQFDSARMRTHQSVDRTPADCPRHCVVEAWADDREGTVGPADLRRLVGDPEAGVAWGLDGAEDDPRSTIWSWVVDTGADSASLARDSPAEAPYESVAVPGRETGR
ncbi:C45 family autoproteolytic acyltransferase/hydolase [Halosimplex halophilum]|uniref:C45 family autoproteolytic acyltransferase/hydolase n=1 Tax=Halosimplex halophilum TaxID=2559572 RepID=UPI00107F57AC|nr:C45 family peptidase [Halosimplex halophilum]